MRRRSAGRRLCAAFLLAGCGANVRYIAPGSTGALPSSFVVSTGAAQILKERYCTATYDEWFAPKCVGELTIAQAKRRFRLIRLVESKGRVLRIDQINSNLQFAQDTPEVSATELVYDGARVVELVGLDRNSIVRTRKRLVAGGIRWLDSSGRPLPEDESPVSGAEQMLDQLGRVVEQRYVDARGAPATRADGVSCVRYRYGSVGLVEDESYFGRDASAQVNNKGVQRILRRFSADGLERETQFLDASGSPLPRADGVQRIVQAYDDNGNSTEEDDFDATGNLHEDDGHSAICRVKHDEFGRTVELSFFDRTGAPVLSSHGYITRRTTWNDRGLATSWSFFDGAGNPARVRNVDHSVQRRELDSRDRMIRKAWYSPDGTPHMKFGAASELYFYDNRDNLILRRSLTDSGEPTRAENGHYSILRQVFDADRLIRQEHLDESGRLFPIDGSTGSVYIYNSLGTRTKLRLDDQGRPMSSDLPK